MRFFNGLLKRLGLIMLNEQREGDEHWSLDSLKTELESPHSQLFLGSAEGRSWQWNHSDPGFSSLDKIQSFAFYRKTQEHSVDLCFVATLNKGRGQGRVFLEETFQILEEEQVKEVLLEVRPSNTRALRAYSNLGFIKINKRPSYYANGEEALVLRLELKKR